MTRTVPLVLSAALAACVSSAGTEPAALLAEDQEQPELALFEHVLTGHFAGLGANGPMTCVALSPRPLTAQQESELLDRFVRLEPAEQCRTGDGDVVQVYDFACLSDELCGGWVTRSGAPATRYAMRFENGAWRFDRDIRILAE